MAPKASRKKTKKKDLSAPKRRERRFSTSSTFMPLWVGITGIAGCFLLGLGVFGLWILDPPVSWASYAVAGGGLGLGLSLWFGQPPETAVAVGDAGVAVEDGKETRRVPWYEVRSLRLAGDAVLVEGKSETLKFSFGANSSAVATLLKEAASRVPDVVDVARSLTQRLPSPETVRGFAQDVEDDQVAGSRCAASKNVIHLEEEARCCPQCGQVYHRDGLPESCVTCEAPLTGRALLA